MRAMLPNHANNNSSNCSSIAVHLPEQQRLVLFGGQFPGFHEIGLPRNLKPLNFRSGRLDQLMQRSEPFRGESLGDGSAAQPEHGGGNHQDRQPACGGQAGRYDRGEATNDVWAYLYESNTWEKRNPQNPPPLRIQAQTCYDSVNGVLIVFGGHANVYPRRDEGKQHTDTWVYDYARNTWSKMQPQVSPSGSSVRFMAFDPVNNVAVNVAINVEGSGEKKQTWVYRYRKAARGSE